MPYDIIPFVEIADRTAEPGNWQTVLDDSEFNLWPDEVSSRQFGLSKCGPSGGPFANRGVPPDPSPRLRQILDQHAEFDKEEPDYADEVDYTFATLGELRQIDLTPSPAWLGLFQAMESLKERHRCADDDIRVVLFGYI